MPQLLLSLMHHRECTGDRLWDGVVQFGTFNRLRMCPVLEVRSLFVFVSRVKFESAG